MISDLRTVSFFLGKQPCRGPARQALLLFPRLKLTGPSPEINPTRVRPLPHGTTGRQGKAELHFFGHFRTSARPPINYPTNIRWLGAFLAKIPMPSAQSPIDPTRYTIHHSPCVVARRFLLLLGVAALGAFSSYARASTAGLVNRAPAGQTRVARGEKGRGVGRSRRGENTTRVRS